MLRHVDFKLGILLLLGSVFLGGVESLKADEGRILKRIQYPALDARKDYSQKKYEFRGVIIGDETKTPGLKDTEKALVADKGFRTVVLNEYKLYDKSREESDYLKLMMERYCLRYNRQMWQLLVEDKIIP